MLKVASNKFTFYPALISILLAGYEMLFEAYFGSSLKFQRNIFWMQAAFHGMTSVGLLGFYWPPPSNYPKLNFRQIVWACDPIGSLLMTAGATLLLLAFDWAGGTFPWHDAHVIGPLISGAILLLFFGLYEWKGRTDGIVAHVFFSRGPNFALSVFAFAVEGFIFYSAVNSIVPQIVLNLGFETNAWRISVRQLSYNMLIIVTSIPVTCVFNLFRERQWRFTHILPDYMQQNTRISRVRFSSRSSSSSSRKYS
jgi:hypothetical protein